MKRKSVLFIMIVVGVGFVGITSCGNNRRKEELKKNFKEAMSQFLSCSSDGSKGKYEEAKEACSKTLDLVSQFGRADFSTDDGYEHIQRMAVGAYSVRARIYRDSDEPDNALTDLNEAINILSTYHIDIPSELGTYRLRADIYYDRQEYSHAIADYSEDIRIRPEYVDAKTNYPYQYQYRGDSYVAVNEYAKAIPDYTKALEILSSKCTTALCLSGRPIHYALLYFKRGIAYAKSHEYDKAIDDYAESIKHDGGIQAANALAWLLATCPNAEYRNAELAITSAQKAVELYPQNAAVLDTLAAAYAEAGNFEKAIQTQEEAIKLLGKDDPAYINHLNVYKANQAWRDIQ